MERQKKLIPDTINWEKIYVNGPKNKVLIFKTIKKEEVIKEITLKEFKKLIKKLSNITQIISTLI